MPASVAVPVLWKHALTFWSALTLEALKVSEAVVITSGRPEQFTPSALICGQSGNRFARVLFENLTEIHFRNSISLKQKIVTFDFRVAS